MPRDAYDDRLPFHRRNLPAGAGARLKEARVATGRSRKDVAAAAGLAMRTLARIERGHQTPRWPTLKRLCEELGLDDRSIALRWSQDEYDVSDDPVVTPGVGLRALRSERGMTISTLAAATGISVSTFSRFERGLIVSRLLGGRAEVSGGLRSEQDPVLDNEAVVKAFGLADAVSLRAACLAAAGRHAPDTTVDGDMKLDGGFSIE